MHPPATFESIRDLFAHRGDSEYGGEAVTQWEHAAQAALRAEAEGAGPTLVPIEHFRPHFAALAGGGRG
jgi:predicted HD phosphohydrolase